MIAMLSEGTCEGLPARVVNHGKRRVSGGDEGSGHTTPTSSDAAMCENGDASATAIPDDCLIEIFLLIKDKADLKALSLVCKRWYTLQASARQRMTIPCDIELSRLSSILTQYHALTDISVAYRNVNANVNVTNTTSRARLNLDLLASPRETSSEFPLRLLPNNLPPGNASPKGVSFGDAGVEVIANMAGSRLRRLVLEGCAGLGDPALAEIGRKCARLEDLVLTSRHITADGLMALFWGCTSLRRIELAGCTGEVGDRGIRTLAASCRDLQVLTVGCRKITDDGIAELAASCSSLRMLDLRGCLGVRSAGLVALGRGCPLLEELFVSFCQGVGDEGIVGLASGCRSLKQLHMKSCPISDRGLVAISENCSRISSLDLSFCDRIGRVGLAALAEGAGRSSLERLDLQQCRQLGDGALVALVRGCAALRALDLRGCQGVTDDGVGRIAQCCPALEGLLLGGYNVGDGALRSLAREARSLRRVHLWGCSGVTDKGITELVSGCTNLEHISIKGPPHGITDASLMSITSLGDRLRSLTVPFCLGITDRGLVALSQWCPNLSKLNVSGCEQVTSIGISAVARSCGTSLLKLDFSRCPKVCDHALAAVGERCSNLRKLLAGSCFALTDGGVSSIAVGVCGPAVRQLSVLGCPNVGDRSMSAIAKGCPNLEALFVSECPLVSCFGMQAIDDGCHSMRVCVSDARC